MAGINRHPAPGLGELQPGWFVVPQNPIDGPVSYIRGIGDILGTGGFAVPQNPVTGYSAGHVLPIGVHPGAKGMINNKPVGVSGCGCGGTCGGCGGGAGMGDLSSDFNAFTADLTAGNYMTAIQAPIFGIPVWGYLAGLALFMFAGGEKHSYAGRGRRAYRAAASAF
jgi:hypothetical protein